MVFDEENISKLRKMPDSKETFDLGRENDRETPNIWIPESTLPGFRKFFTRFFHMCYSVELGILRAIAVGMGLEENSLLKYHQNGDNQIRLLHYPSIEEEALRSGEKERIAAHTDFGTMTMLFQDSVGGLEVEDINRKGVFIPAPYIPGTIVVNIGDLLMRWSNDRLHSTLHRVGAPPVPATRETHETNGGGSSKTSRFLIRARYSIPYFVTADRDKMIDCLPGCYGPCRPKRYDPIVAGEYINMRLNATY